MKLRNFILLVVSGVCLMLSASFAAPACKNLCGMCPSGTVCNSGTGCCEKVAISNCKNASCVNGACQQGYLCNTRSNCCEPVTCRTTCSPGVPNACPKGKTCVPAPAGAGYCCQ
jgi:hypothetical protein